MADLHSDAAADISHRGALWPGRGSATEPGEDRHSGVSSGFLFVPCSVCMTVLVTGAAGFIGFHLSTRLLEQGTSVVGFDNVNPITTLL